MSIALHTALSHLDKRNTYVRMLFIDYSSAFNTIVPTKLITKLRTLGLNTSLCNWILDFLTGRPRSHRGGCRGAGRELQVPRCPRSTPSSVIRPSTRCEPGLGSEFPVVHDQLLCLADVEREVVALAPHCHITKDLSWSTHTYTVVKRARQCFFPLGRLNRFGLRSSKFYSCTTESIVTGCITAWYVILLRQLLIIRPQGATEGSEYSPVHHWGRAPSHPGPLYQAVSEALKMVRLQPPS
jgi:hypothetical protein